MIPVGKNGQISGRTPCGQPVDFAEDGDRVDELGTARRQAAPNPPTLIHRLPTLRRGWLRGLRGQINNSNLLNLSHISFERSG